MSVARHSSSYSSRCREHAHIVTALMVDDRVPSMPILMQEGRGDMFDALHRGNAIEATSSDLLR